MFSASGTGCMVQVSQTAVGSLAGSQNLDPRSGCLVPGSKNRYGNRQKWYRNTGFGPEICPADRPNRREINFTRTRDWVLEEIKTPKTGRMILFVSTGGSDFYRTSSQTRFQVRLEQASVCGGYPPPPSGSHVSSSGDANRRSDQLAQEWESPSTRCPPAPVEGSALPGETLAEAPLIPLR